jgi:carbamoyl-phosphate synthase large subunit
MLSQIKKYNIVVIGSDTYEKGECAGSLLADKYYQAPPINQEAEYINFLNDINEKEKIDLLIPASDAEAVLLSKYSNQVKTRFFLADYETVSLFKDKLRATLALLNNNINVPRICDNLFNEKKVIFRKRNSVNSQGIYIVDLEKAEYIENHFNPDYFVQPYIEGDTVIVDVFSDKNGTPKLIIPRKTIEIKDGTAFRSQIVYDETIIDITKKICNLYKLPGFCNLDFIVNNGEYYFIELNVRFAGSGIFSIIASFNYMETYLEHFVLNEPLQDMDYYMKYVCWDSIVTRYLEELIYPNISE